MKNLKSKNQLLFFGSEVNPIYLFLRKKYKVTAFSGPLDIESDLIKSCEAAISFGYRHVLKPDILRKFKRPVVNLHIAFLPYNRGADPNLWSFLEKTPSGVTIHEMDKEIDTGPILVQKKVEHDLQKDTLSTSYDRLFQEICRLFFREFPALLAGKHKATEQSSGGSFHRLRDKEKYLNPLS